MLWEIEIESAAHLPDREAARVLSQCRALGVSSIRDVRSARSFLIEGDLRPVGQIEKIAAGFLADTVVETYNAGIRCPEGPSTGQIRNPKLQIRNRSSTFSINQG